MHKMFKAWLALVEKGSVEVNWRMGFPAIEILVIASKIPKPLFMGSLQKMSEVCFSLFVLLCILKSSSYAKLVSFIWGCDSYHC
jgi:hypothetical protein